MYSIDFRNTNGELLNNLSFDSLAKLQEFLTCTQIGIYTECKYLADCGTRVFSKLNNEMGK